MYKAIAGNRPVPRQAEPGWGGQHWGAACTWDIRGGAGAHQGDDCQVFRIGHILLIVSNFWHLASRAWTKLTSTINVNSSYIEQSNKIVICVWIGFAGLISLG